MKRNGFTLIELLVVISIMGVLATLVFASFTSSQRQARDTQRKSDIKQFSTSLEGFANKNNSLYPQRPVANGVSASTVLCTDMGLTSCVVDPRYTLDSSFQYLYQSDGSVSNGTAVATKYVLWSKLENSAYYWVICSTGNVGVKAQTGFSVSGGGCPL